MADTHSYKTQNHQRWRNVQPFNIFFPFSRRFISLYIIVHIKCRVVVNFYWDKCDFSFVIKNVARKCIRILCLRTLLLLLLSLIKFRSFFSFSHTLSWSDWHYYVVIFLSFALFSLAVCIFSLAFIAIGKFWTFVNELLL